MAGASHARSLWFSLPSEVAIRFRPHTDKLAKRILDEIQHAVPEYAQPLEGKFGKVITLSIEQAVVSCIDSIEGLGPTQHGWMELFNEIGRRVFHAGGSLNSLQAAYRVGGRTAWRYVSGFGQSMRMSAQLLCVSAEAIFAYVDEISSYSVEGYTAAQARAAGTMERRRRRLLELILATPPSSPQTIASMARAASWRVPEWVTVVALEPRDEEHSAQAQLSGPSPLMHEDVLLDLEGAQPCLVTADPERDLRTLQVELKGWRAAVGPRVRLTDAASSLHWAQRTMELIRQGTIEDRPVVRTSEYLFELWLLIDDFLLHELSEQVLRPLGELTAKQQVRLGETLRTWLECNGSTPEIAEVLKIHPQTVRYRLNQLVELFGDRLNNPSDRLRMQIALEAHRLLGTRPHAEGG
ncbi:helix-turn-helix domain-containing protein [Amycolatopsis nigrescens]|uniref:PucR family transcriptional regulator n=1 Tax=Amycolatopsis nigrescens TaxID=381445 RepID=UPI00037BA535